MQALRRPFYGWWIILIAGMVAFSSGPGQSFAFSVFLDSLIEDTALSRTAISTLYAVGTGLSALMVVTVSRLADRYGARSTLIAAAIGLGLACFAMSIARGPIMVFAAFAALRALGQGSLTINCTLLVAQWWVRRRGRAMALMGLGFPLAVATLPSVANFLIDTIGWREAYAILGVMVWVMVLPGAIFVVRNRPEDMGLYPDGADGPPPGEEEDGIETGVEDRPMPVLTSAKFWILAIPLSTTSLISTGLVFHQAAIIAEHGLSPAVSAAMFVPFAISSAGLSLLAGDAADRFGPKWVFAAGMGTLLAGMALALVMTSLAMAIVYAILIGASSGFSRIVTSVTWAHFYGRQGLGRVQGSAVMVAITASALGPLPLAWLQAQFDGFRPGIAILMVLPVIATITVALARPPGRGAQAPVASRD